MRNQCENNSMAKSAMYNMIAKFGQMIIQLIIQMVLARLINASDYGIVAIITVAINFLNMFADMGLGVSIIQRDNVEKRGLNDIFTVSLYIGIILTGIMIIIGFPASVIYKNPIYKKLFLLSSIVALMNALNVVPNSLLMRKKRFDLIAMRSIAVNFFSGICAIMAAYKGWSYYSLVLNYVVAAVGLLIWNLYSCKDYKLRFVLRIRISKITSFMGKYSLFQFVFNVLNYFTRNLDYLIIGAKMNSETLGYYQKAYTLNLYPNQLFTNVISSVFHPYMRDLKTQYEKLYFKWVEITEELSIIASFVMSIMFISSYEIINIMFGGNWNTSVGCLHWLSICVWAQMLSSTCGAIFLSVERTDQTLKLGVVNVFIILGSVLCGVAVGKIKTLAFFVGIAYNLIFWLTVFIVSRTLSQPLFVFFRRVIPDFIIAAIWMIIWDVLPIQIANVMKSFGIKFALTVLYYVLCLGITGRIKNVYNKFVKTLRSIFGRGIV